MTAVIQLNVKDKVYISGPMTGRVDFNFPLFNTVAKFWRSEGYKVSNPAEKGEIHGWEWSDYLRYDLDCIVNECFAVAVLPEWETSKGALLEVHVAKELGMPIHDAITLDLLW